MTQLERTIKTTQHRLWLNRWLVCASTSLAIAGGVFAAVILIGRLYDLSVPILGTGAALACGGFLASIVWTAISRADAVTAAAALDGAAGLRERLSSAQYCQRADDPFAKAVVADAEQVSSTLSPRQHIRVTIPTTFGLTASTVALAALMFLVPVGLMASDSAHEEEEQVLQAKQTRVAVKKEMDRVKKVLESTPALEDLKDELGDFDKLAGGDLTRPADIRHEAIKKIDKLTDALKQKRQSEKYDAVRDMRKMMRGLKVPKSADTPTQKIAKALSKGDFKTAKEEINQLREQLATLKSKDDEEMAKKLGKQLEELAKQLEKLAQNKELERKLQQAGIKKEDLERMLENLKKKDLDQIRKQLAEKGFTQKQIEKMAKQLKKQAGAGSKAKRLAQAMKKAASGSSLGQMGNSMAGLSMAADQLSELEQLESEMNQMDAAMADLQASKEGLGNCPACKGTGRRGGKPCGRCNGSGQGQNRGGQGKKMASGRGGLAQEEETPVGFKTQRAKVHTGAGAIIGQFLFDGEQIKGDVSSSFTEVLRAAEHDASDRINRNRVPRQYQKAVKAYFSNVRRSIESAKAGKGEGTGEEPTDDEPGGQ